MTGPSGTGARRWLGYAALVVLFAVACGLLSWWQFARREEAVERIEQVERNWDAEPRPIEDVLPEPGAFDPADTWTPVRVTGEYLVEEQLLVRGRPRDGRPGFEVLVPLLTDDGRVFIVDRGWVPTGTAQDAPDAVPAAPSGPVEVIARVKAGEPAIPGRGAPPGQVATIELPLIAGLLAPRETYTGAYGLLVSEDPPARETPALAERPKPDEGPHLSYAIQWIIFAVLAFAALVWAINNERRARAAEATSTPSPRRPRRDLDAEAEDALLDR